MDKLQSHFVLCLLTGLVAVLPVGGTILLVVYAECSLSPLIPAHLYIPGAGLLLVIVLLYLLGLTLTSVIGRWLWCGLDSTLAHIPGLGTIYRTLKQILGFDTGAGALFERVVLVQNDSVGGTEIGLVTGSEGAGSAKQFVVFVPGSPNPAQGRLLRLPAHRLIATDWTVDKALKSLFSLGKV